MEPDARMDLYALGDMTPEDFARHVLKLNQRAIEHTTALITQRGLLKVCRAEADRIMSQISHHEMEADVAVRAVGHAINNRIHALMIKSGRLTPPEPIPALPPDPPAPPAVTPPPEKRISTGALPMALSLAVVAAGVFACCVFAQRKALSVSTSPSAGPPLTAGEHLTIARRLMHGRQWDEAVKHFRAADGAGADPELSLGQVAWCLYSAGSLADALAETHDLDNRTMGASVMAPMVRGLVYYAQKEYDRAIIEFKCVIDLKPDHPDAMVMLRRCEKSLTRTGA